MRIGFDAKRAFLNRSGLGNYSRNTLLSLKKYFPDNEYLLFTPEIKEGIFPEQSQFDVYSPDSPTAKIFRSLWRSFSLSEQLKHHNIGLFHGLSHELPSGIQNTGVKSVVTIHDLIFLRYPQFYKPIDRKIYFQKIKYACEVAECVIAVSDQTRDDIIRYLKVTPDKIKLLYQGIGERYFSNHKSEFPEIKLKYNLPDHYVLSVGTIEPRKNQMNIIKAMESAKIEMPVVLIGKPTMYASKISDYISTSKSGIEVYFPGHVDDDDLPCLYQNAELLVYISVFEGFGLPIVEAMASGCPVLASDRSCMPETGADAALYCDPANIEELGRLIREIIENDRLKKQLIEKGKKRVADFSPEKAATSLFDIYKSILPDG